MAANSPELGSYLRPQFGSGTSDISVQELDPRSGIHAAPLCLKLRGAQGKDLYQVLCLGGAGILAQPRPQRDLRAKSRSCGDFRSRRWGQQPGEYSWARVETARVRLLWGREGAGCLPLVRTTAVLCTINKKICIRTFTLREERGICIIKCGMLKK